MRVRSLIHIERCQIKSSEKFSLFCKTLDILEKEFGVREVEISMKNNFICPDIDLSVFATSHNPMELLIGTLAIRLDKIKYGKDSKYEKD